MSAALYLRLYWTLLASFCALGICVALLQPLFSAPDEPLHWATGHVRAEQAMGAEGCVKSVVVERRKLFPPAKNTLSPLVCMPESDLYGDALTYPGVLLSKLIFPRQGESPLRQVQAIALARLLQGLLVVACLLRAGLLAYRGQRSGMLVLGAFVMSPLLAQQAFAISADGAQLAFAITLFSAVLFWERLTWLDVGLFAVLGWSAMAKPFMLTCILPALLCAFWFARLRQTGSATIGTVLRDLFATLKPTRAPSVATAMLWLGILLSLLTVVIALLSSRVHETAANAVINAQFEAEHTSKLDRLLANPSLIFELLRTMPRNPWTLRNLVSPLGWLDVQMSRAIVQGFGRLLVIALALEVVCAVWSRRLLQRAATATVQAKRVLLPLLLGLLGPVGNLLFVVLVVYVLWSPIDATRAVGVQGRYFFGSTIVMFAVLFGAAQTVFGLPVSAPQSKSSEQRPLRERVGLVLAPLLLLVLVLPYVARVYVDIVSWYYY